MSDQQIIDALKITTGIYKTYLKRIMKQDAEIIKATLKPEQVMHELRLHLERLQQGIAECQLIILNQQSDPAAKIQAIRLKLELSADILRTLKEGPDYLGIANDIQYNRPAEQTIPEQKQD